MDPLSQGIFGLNSQPLTLVSSLIDKDYIFAILLVFIVLVIEKKNNRRLKIFTALGLALMVGFALKEIYQVERPCTDQIIKTKIGETGCSGYSFPSLHTILAFTLATAFIRKKYYIWILIFALFVAFTRIYLGVHRFEDIAASAAIAPLIYLFIDSWWKDGKGS
jgi:membrane-associated phospholipid phosphatase